jgi:hypothetical protein
MMHIYDLRLDLFSADTLIMAATIAAIRKNRKIPDQEKEEDSLLDNLITRAPPQDSWEAEFCLGMLVAG